MNRTPDIKKASETLISLILYLNISGIIVSFFVNNDELFFLFLFIVGLNIFILLLRKGILYHSGYINVRSKI